jgi:hypothetical protein
VVSRCLLASVYIRAFFPLLILAFVSSRTSATSTRGLKTVEPGRHVLPRRLKKLALQIDMFWACSASFQNFADMGLWSDSPLGLETQQSRLHGCSAAADPRNKTYDVHFHLVVPRPFLKNEPNTLDLKTMFVDPPVRPASSNITAMRLWLIRRPCSVQKKVAAPADVFMSRRYFELH